MMGDVNDKGRTVLGKPVQITGGHLAAGVTWTDYARGFSNAQVRHFHASGGRQLIRAIQSARIMGIRLPCDRPRQGPRTRPRLPLRQSRTSQDRASLNRTPLDMRADLRPGAADLVRQSPRERCRSRTVQARPEVRHARRNAHPPLLQVQPRRGSNRRAAAPSRKLRLQAPRFVLCRCAVRAAGLTRPFLTRQSTRTVWTRSPQTRRSWQSSSPSCLKNAKRSRPRKDRQIGSSRRTRPRGCVGHCASLGAPGLTIGSRSGCAR